MEGRINMEKGAIAGVGGLIMLAIAIIVGAILLQGSAQNIDSVVNTRTIANVSLGVASNSTTVYLTDYQAINSPVVTNGTNGVTIGAGNYTLTNKVLYNGALAVSVLPKSPAAAELTGYTWYINGVAEPTSYGDGAARSVTALILIMMALAIAAVAIGYAVKSYSD